MSYLKNTSGQFLYIAMISAADGSAITSGTVSGFRSIDGGAQASVTGTISHKGNGQWELALSQADTNGDEIGYLFTHASGIPVSISVVTDTKKVGTLQDLTAAQVNAEADAAIETYHLDHLLAADYDPASKPGVATALLNELVESDAGVSRFTANALEQAPSGGGGLTQQDVRDAMKLAPTAGSPDAGSVDAHLDAIEDDTGTSGVVVASGSKSGYSLSAAGVDAIIDEVVEGSLTLRQVVRVFLAALGGKSNGGGTSTVNFRDNADSKNRISATVDASGNRTAVTLDGS